ncbi:hypothetical protein KJ756_01105 [Patescibacteria group bacterium]|nr:hypothetical protein [Patescibacteria group bacterium]MBU4082500.1 hypothetical protein [Patescibacteria group bacterium]MCG2809181.1 hypothetical protein [Candidatus Portnoybacteria bacterium]
MKKNLYKILFVIAYYLLSADFALAGYKIEIALPNVVSGKEVTFPEYIGYLYTFGIGFVIVAALGGLVIGGFSYMLSDVVTTKEKSKEYIWGALSGLVLILAAYLILSKINPNLVNWSITL